MRILRKSKVVTYPRVHMFSLDLSLLNGNMKSGSMGCSLINYPIIVNARFTTKEDIIQSKFNNLNIKIKNIIIEFRKKEKTTSFYKININTPDILRSHIGLGSSTSVCAGILMALYKLEKIQFNINYLLYYGVGTQSACSSKLLLNPGFIIEYGYDISTIGGVCLHKELYDYREKFSKELISFSNYGWYMVVAIPKKLTSISGELEKTFWDKHYPDDVINTLKINYFVSQMIFPGILNNNFQIFIDGMSKVTKIGTKSIEEKIQSTKTKDCLKLLRKQLGFAAVSSLGPTVYSFTNNPKYTLPEIDEYLFIKVPL